MAEFWLKTFLLCTLLMISYINGSTISAPSCNCEDAHDLFPQDAYHTIACSNLITLEDVACLDMFLKNISDKDSLPMYINLQNSDIDIFPNDIFISHNIYSLAFPNCNLREIPSRLFTPICANLIGLYFSNNQISEIRENAFSGCSSLQEINLDYNNLTEIDAIVLEDSESLLELSIQNNKLDSLNGFGNSEKIHNLFFDNNDISYIDKDAFAGMDEIQELQLKNNQITTLENGTFDSIVSPMTYVFLEGNPFYCDCSLKWLQDWLQVHLSMTDDPQCVAPVEGSIKTLEFCPEF